MKETNNLSLLEYLIASIVSYDSSGNKYSWGHTLISPVRPKGTNGRKDMELTKILKVMLLQIKDGISSSSGSTNTKINETVYLRRESFKFYDKKETKEDCFLFTIDYNNTYSEVRFKFSNAFIELCCQNSVLNSLPVNKEEGLSIIIDRHLFEYSVKKICNKMERYNNSEDYFTKQVEYLNETKHVESLKDESNYIIGFNDFFWIGTNGNLYSKLLYTYKQATEYIATLYNCKNCIDCKNLSNKNSWIFIDGNVE